MGNINEAHKYLTVRVHHPSLPVPVGVLARKQQWHDLLGMSKRADLHGQTIERCGILPLLLFACS